MSGRFTVETIFKGTDNTSSVLKSIQAGVKATQGALSGPVSIADKGIAGFKKVGAVAAVAGLAAGAAFHHLVETGADFEQSITNVGAVMGKRRSQIAELEAAALKLGVSTQFSSSEVSEAMEMMARKGFDSEEILAGIPGVLDAIAASGQGMAEVATVVGSSIRGFGLDAKEASHVANLLAFTAEKTGATITDMGTALAIAAPTARALGVSIEDTAVGVGLLQRMGIDASTAGTATATMLAKISHPSKEAGDKMKAMGIAFKDAKGNMLPFRDVLGQFVKAGEKAGGNMDKMSFFAELVGLRGDKAALGLEHMVKSGDFDKLVEGIKNTGDYAHKVATIRMDTTQGSWKLLTSTVEVLETKLFGLNNGGFKTAIDRVNAWVSANQGLIVSGAAEYAGKLTDKVVALAGSIDKGVVTLGWFKDGLGKAFENSRSVAVFGTVLDKVFGGSDGEGPGKKAYDLGKNIGDVIDKFILFTFYVKAAEGATWAFGNAAKLVAGATWLWEFAVTGTKAAIVAYETWAGVGAATTVAFGGAMTTASLGAGELALAETGAAAGAVELEGAAVGAEAGIGGIGLAAGAALVPIAAVAAALVGIAAAAYELYQFSKENGGMAGVGGFLGIGTDNWGFEGVDEVMNRQARAERDKKFGTGADAEINAGQSSKGRRYAFGPGGVTDPGSGYGMTPALPPGPYAGGYQMPPAAAPTLGPVAPVVSAREHQSDAQAQSITALKSSLDSLTSKLNAAGGTIKLILPKGVTAETSGAPGVEVLQSGGF